MIDEAAVEKRLSRIISNKVKDSIRYVNFKENRQTRFATFVSDVIPFSILRKFGSGHKLVIIEEAPGQFVYG